MFKDARERRGVADKVEHENDEREKQINKTVQTQYRNGNIIKGEIRGKNVSTRK